MASRRMLTRLTALTTSGLVSALALAAVPAGAAPPESSDGTDSSAERSARAAYRPGAAGVGDAYFPEAGNGGYDVEHYTLDLQYRPRAGALGGTATIRAVATQNLSRFNLDLDGMRVLSVLVDGTPADWRRDGGELIVRPTRDVDRGDTFRTVVTYAGTPLDLGGSGFIRTSDGVIVAGQPEGPSTWYPVNDHPSDRASYTFVITAPAGRPVLANGRLVSKERDGRSTTWTWRAAEPMASYLTTIDIGRWRLSTRTEDGIEYRDAVDPRLFTPYSQPRTGDGLLVSQAASSTWKRAVRTVSVPADGGRLSFWVDRQTEDAWDFFFVEAHTPGEDDWTTLPDERGATSRQFFTCNAHLQLHPFVEHYVTQDGDACRPRGTTGRWHAASGSSGGYERWVVDLSRWAGEDVELSLSYASDQSVQGPGVFVDDVRGPAGDGTTSFEPDGDALDGWTVPGSPPGSPENYNDWVAGTAEDIGSTGDIAQDALDRQGEVLGFLGESFGPYPFDVAGGIVDPELGGFALETQTRPVYSADFFTDDVSATSVVVHELAHQWYGDSLTIKRWRHIWLNEGFATYAEWLWSEELGLLTPQQIFDDVYDNIPRNDPFWDLTIGDPGPEALFDFAVYYRGAMTLQALRNAVGDEDFFEILTTWSQQRAGTLVTTPQFVRLAERISGQDLDDLFEAWLFTGSKPPRPAAPRVTARDGADARTEAARWQLLGAPWHGRGSAGDLPAALDRR